MSVTRHNGIEEDDLGAFIYYDEFLEVDRAYMDSIKNLEADLAAAKAELATLRAENERLTALVQAHQTYTPKEAIKCEK
jgi:hypothetical protein